MSSLSEDLALSTDDRSLALVIGNTPLELSRVFALQSELLIPSLFCPVITHADEAKDRSLIILDP